MDDKSYNQTNTSQDDNLINDLIEKTAENLAIKDEIAMKEETALDTDLATENDVSSEIKEESSSDEVKQKENSDSKEKSQNQKSNLKDFKDIEFKLDNLNLGKNSILSILDDVRIIKKRISHIENVLREQERSQYSPARDLPGITGKYDGQNMITSEGKKIEVPVNYAAKSLLVYGDELKRIEEDGKHAFKIIKKVDRKKIEGVLSKKDGKYVILSDAGTFNLHKSAVEFRNIKQGEWVQAYIPEKGQTNEFAAIDKVIKKDKEVKMFEVKSSKPDLPVVKPFVKQEVKPAIVREVNPDNLPSKNQNENQRNYQSSSQPVIKPQSQPQDQSKPQNPTSPLPKITFSDEDLV